jgi:RNA polymerase sigma-70 factor, ECF subfamily
LHFARIESAGLAGDGVGHAVLIGDGHLCARGNGEIPWGERKVLDDDGVAVAIRRSWPGPTGVCRRGAAARRAGGQGECRPEQRGDGELPHTSIRPQLKAGLVGWARSGSVLVHHAVFGATRKTDEPDWSAWSITVPWDLRWDRRRPISIGCVVVVDQWITEGTPKGEIREESHLRPSDSAGDSEQILEMIDVELASDANLVVAIARWHQPALAEAYCRHGGSVHALSRRILRNDQPAEEITQDVFLDLWQHPEKFDAQRGTLRSFLLARTHGKSVDHIRSETSRRRREDRTTRETAAAGYDIEHQVWDMAVAEQVKEVLGMLPDELRQPIELAYFGGHAYREVADMLETPEGTIKSRIRVGLGRLRVNLSERGVEPAGAER